MKSFERLLELLENKKNQFLNEEEKKKVEFLNNLFNDKACFFKIDADTAFGILDFLGVSETEAKAMYFDLISVESFKEVTPKVRYTTSNKI